MALPMLRQSVRWRSRLLLPAQRYLTMLSRDSVHRQKFKHAQQIHNLVHRTPKSPQLMPDTGLRPMSLVAEQAANWHNSPFQSRVFNALGLEKCTDEELHELFEVLAEAHADTSPLLHKHDVAVKFRSVLSETISDDEIEAFTNEFWDYETEMVRKETGKDEVDSITEEVFISRVKTLGQTIDNRMIPMAAIFGASGISIGVIIPVMPQLAQILDLSTAQYGTIVGAFAFTKMIGNVPAAMAVEKLGCKPVLAGTMVALGMAIGSIGLVNSYEGLVLSRFAGGACIAGFVSAAFVYLADISNPLNRGSTIAPPSTAFTAGTALGPALGGGLHAFLNLQQTFLTAGGMIMLIGAATHMFLRPPAVLRSQRDLKRLAAEEVAEANGEAAEKAPKQSIFKQWSRLLRNPAIANMTALNMGYWLVLSGVNMTLLPMILVDPTFGLTPVEVGSVFAGISVVGVIVTPIAGRLIDRLGRPQTAIPAAAVLSTAMMASAFTDDLSSLLALVGVWTVAGSVLSVAPTAYITDLTDFKDRPQGLALIRTAGDVGMLTGSIAAGLVADYSSNLQSIQVNGSIMLGIAAFTGFRFFNILRKHVQSKTL